MRYNLPVYAGRSERGDTCEVRGGGRKLVEILTFITNNFSLPDMTVAELYRSCWHVELFFKRIKQHLGNARVFLGNAS